MNLLELLEKAGYTSKRKAACYGGEYFSACPFCQEGHDRFLIWPQRPNKDGTLKGGRYSCRKCGRYGDAITFLIEFKGLSYPDACRVVKVELKERHRTPPPSRAKPKPPTVPDPTELWQQKAGDFVKWSHDKLLGDPVALAMLTQRGFTRDSLTRFQLGFSPGDPKTRRDFYRDRQQWGLPPETKEDGKPRKLWLPAGLVIPTFSTDGRIIKVKVRRSSWHEGDKLPKYVEISGSRQSPSVYGNTTLGVALVMESELDSLLLIQQAGDLCFCIGLGGATKQLDSQTHDLIKATPTVFFCPDFDVAGAVAWERWAKMFPHVRRLLTPSAKSAGDAILEGLDLRKWINEALAGGRQVTIRAQCSSTS